MFSSLRTALRQTRALVHLTTIQKTFVCFWTSLRNWLKFVQTRSQNVSLSGIQFEGLCTLSIKYALKWAEVIWAALKKETNFFFFSSVEWNCCNDYQDLIGLFGFNFNILKSQYWFYKSYLSNIYRCRKLILLGFFIEHSVWKANSSHLNFMKFYFPPSNFPSDAVFNDFITT